MIFRNLKDPNTPLLGNNLWGLHKMRMLTRDETMSAKIRQILFLTPITMMIVTEFIELWIVRFNAVKAMNNLSISIMSLVCCLKIFAFIVGKEKWISVFEYITKVDKQNRSKRNEKANIIIQEYTSYAMNIDYFYGIFSVVSCVFGVISPYSVLCLSKEGLARVKSGVDPYPEIISSWAPFDKSRGYGYLVLSVLHVCYFSWGCFVVWTYDTTVFKLMALFAAQFKMLALNCRNIFGDGTETLPTREVYRRIKECHMNHVNLLKYIQIFADLLEPLFFFSVIVYSLLICTSAISITSQSTSGLNTILVSEYLMGVIFELFLYCWFSTVVSNESDGVEYSVFESGWVEGDVRVRRSLVLLVGQLRRPVIFRAGPFTNLNLATFIAVIKGAYSYYTLLNENKA